MQTERYADMNTTGHLDPLRESSNIQNFRYEVGHITFVVTPVYSVENGEIMRDVMLKLMRADVVRERENQ